VAQVILLLERIWTLFRPSFMIVLVDHQLLC
jgi:hypothetical protein